MIVSLKFFVIFLHYLISNLITMKCRVSPFTKSISAEMITVISCFIINIPTSMPVRSLNNLLCSYFLCLILYIWSLLVAFRHEIIYWYFCYRFYTKCILSCSCPKLYLHEPYYQHGWSLFCLLGVVL